MIFFLERLAYRLVAIRAFFWLLLLPPLIYAVIMALTPSVHTLSSSFTVPEGAPIAQTGTPTGVTPLAPLLSTPALWEAFIKSNFSPQRIMGYPRGYGLPVSAEKTDRIYNEALSGLTLKADKNTLQTIYTGGDAELGSHLVAYYSTTLHQRVQEGYKRQGSHLTPPEIALPRMDPVTPASRLLWSRGRALPTLLWFVAGVLVLLFVLTILELTDTSYKSEKQIAKDTLLPILGRLPNLNAIPVAATTPQPHDM